MSHWSSIWLSDYTHLPLALPNSNLQIFRTACAHMHTHAHINIHAYTCTHTHVHIHMHTDAHIHMHTHVHTCTHTCAHMCTYIHMHTYAHTCTGSLALSLCSSLLLVHKSGKSYSSFRSETGTVGSFPSHVIAKTYMTTHGFSANFPD